ncbi:MAG: hypothetical protein VST68_02900 [Nitrospirota bacterium]|nr:hypothetical protein [Nitrospirota bacterium]
MEGIALTKHQAICLAVSEMILVAQLVLLSTPSLARRPLNTITIDNQSGQVSEIKVIGPSKVFIKVPLDQKRTVRVKQGEYYLLMRYGFSPKEHVYTKSEPFLVNEPEGQYSMITFTLHRVLYQHPNAQRVSGDEYESTTLSDEEH